MPSACLRPVLHGASFARYDSRNSSFDPRSREATRATGRLRFDLDSTLTSAWLVVQKVGPRMFPVSYCPSVRPREYRAFFGWLAAIDACTPARHRLTQYAFLVQRDAPHRRARFFLDLAFAVAAAAPRRER